MFLQENIELLNDSALNKNALPQNAVDLFITSPPYNVGIDYASNNDSLDYQNYLNFCSTFLENCLFWAKDSARFCLNIPLDKSKGGRRSVGADLTVLAQKVGWKFQNTVIWNEGSIPVRTAWGSFASASAPFVTTPAELIVVLYKREWKKTSKGTSTIKKEDFIAWTNGVWEFKAESKKRIGHPAPFPKELPRRCIQLFSYEGDVVCDPFSGSGTTMIESCVSNRKFIGIEIDPGYIELSKKRFFSEISKERTLFDIIGETK